VTSALAALGGTARFAELYAELTTHASWTPSKVRKRHPQLAAWAMQRWALPKGTPAEAADLDDDEPDEQ
jgi:hypothetical protein